MVNVQIQTEKKRSASLKEKLASVTPMVEDLKMKKEERMKQFADTKAQIEKISGEISGYSLVNNVMISSLTLDEQDFSLRKLTEYQTHLRTLQKEKVSRYFYEMDLEIPCGCLHHDLDCRQSN